MKQWDAVFLKVVSYPERLSYIVPVPKKDGRVRMCVDFWDLNKACPKEDFPLPVTEVIIDHTSSYEVFSFMDGSSGYNQIKMDVLDQKHTAFRTPRGISCYKVMSFGLQNASNSRIKFFRPRSRNEASPMQRALLLV